MVETYWNIIHALITIFSTVANAVVTVVGDPIWLTLGVAGLVAIMVLRLIF